MHTPTTGEKFAHGKILLLIPIFCYIINVAFI